MIPRLYHASSYLQEELKPGIAYTGEKVEWDETESNEWLYATSNKEAAIAQGLASAIEHHWLLHRFQSSGNHLAFTFDAGTPVPTRRDLERLKVYLYVIHAHVADGWVKNSNTHNKLRSEYRTQNTVRDRIASASLVDMKQWLQGKDVSLTSAQPGYAGW